MNDQDSTNERARPRYAIRELRLLEADARRRLISAIGEGDVEEILRFAELAALSKIQRRQVAEAIAFLEENFEEERSGLSDGPVLTLCSDASN